MIASVRLEDLKAGDIVLAEHNSYNLVKGKRYTVMSDDNADLFIIGLQGPHYLSGEARYSGGYLINLSKVGKSINQEPIHNDQIAVVDTSDLMYFRMEPEKAAQLDRIEKMLHEILSINRPRSEDNIFD